MVWAWNLIATSCSSTPSCFAAREAIPTTAIPSAPSGSRSFPKLASPGRKSPLCSDSNPFGQTGAPFPMINGWRISRRRPAPGADDSRVSHGALGRDALQISAFAKRLHGILGQSLRRPPLANRRPYICGKRALEQRFSGNQVAVPLREHQLLVLHKRSLAVKFLCHRHRLNHRFDFPFKVMALIDGVYDVSRFSGLPFEAKNFVKDPENLVRIDRTECQIIVGIPAVVKMEPAEQVL